MNGFLHYAKTAKRAFFYWRFFTRKEKRKIISDLIDTDLKYDKWKSLMRPKGAYYHPYSPWVSQWPITQTTPVIGWNKRIDYSK